MSTGLQAILLPPALWPGASYLPSQHLIFFQLKNGDNSELNPELPQESGKNLEEFGQFRF